MKFTSIKWLSLLLASVLSASLFSPTSPSSAVPNSDSALSKVYGLQVESGYYHSCAVQNSGTVKCWGDNANGQLGNSLKVASPIPVSATGISNGIQVDAGEFHSCALLADGTVKCWGGAGFGLGDGLSTNSSTPLQVSGISNALSVNAGGSNSCAVLETAEVKCWGHNYSGQLGDGTKLDRMSPVLMSGISGAVEVSTSGGHTCVLLNDGTVKCVGENSYGQLGDGTTTGRSTAVAMLGVDNAIAVSAGASSTCVVLETGIVKCVGYNREGKLGDGTTTDRRTLVTVSGISNAVSVSNAYWHTCAVLANAEIKCWGSNGHGQLGDNTTTLRSTPVTVSGASNAVSVAVGHEHTCALFESGFLKCWGNDGGYQLGRGIVRNSKYMFGIEDRALYTPSEQVSGISALEVSAGLTSLTFTNRGTYFDQGFNLRYKPLGGETWNSQQCVITCSISGLTPATNYEIQYEKFHSTISLGEFGDSFSTGGTGSFQVQIEDSGSEPVSLGDYSWESNDGKSRSSNTVRGTALGAVSFSSVPAKLVFVAVDEAILEDGSVISGTFLAQATTGGVTLTLPPAPVAITKTVRVELPSGDPVPNARVESTNLSKARSFQSNRFWGTVNRESTLSGVTDENGELVLSGFELGDVLVSATYDDGYLFQSTGDVAALTDITTLQLDYMPIIEIESEQELAALNALVEVPMMVAASPGVRVGIQPPSGASQKPCKKRVKLSSTTDSNGQALLKVCASASGNYQITSAGAVSAGALTIHVKNTRPMPVTSLDVRPSSSGTITVAWGEPEFAGGVPIKSYNLVAKSGKKSKKVTVRAGTISFTNMSVDISGLAPDMDWIISVAAVNKFGASANVQESVIVRGIR